MHETVQPAVSSGPPPGILYWKWNDSIFEPGQPEAGMNDIAARSGFGAVCVALHHVTKPFDDPAVRALLKRASDTLHQAGRKLYLDIDPRDEGRTFRSRHPDQTASFTRLITARLDERGRASVDLPWAEAERWINKIISKPERVLAAWAVEDIDPESSEQRVYRTATSIIESLRIEPRESDSQLIVDAGRQHAHNTLVVFPEYPHAIPDPYSDELIDYVDELHAEAARDIHPDGLCVDEWGYGCVIETDEHGVVLSYLPWSKGMDAAYGQSYGAPLTENLLHLFFAPEGQTGLRVQTINRYLACLRTRMAENEAAIYDSVKRHLGADAFVGTHPTWWGAHDCAYPEVFYNGFDWWEVKRDVAQTDEAVPMPIRLALAHKWGGRFWYNMYYSCDQSLESHFAESWTNACFGGRTHHLGYRSEAEAEFGHVETVQEGQLEQLWECEALIDRLCKQQTAQPDSRVLLLTGMESITNWALAGNLSGKFTNEHPNMRAAYRLANGLFDADWLCDFIPTTEIANGSLQLDGKRAVYGTQTYDAVIMLFPEAMQPVALQKLTAFFERNPQCLLIGEMSLDAEGHPAGESVQRLRRSAAQYFAEAPAVETLAEILTEWGVPRNKWSNGCLLQDGSAVFAAAGATQPSGNPLDLTVSIRGHAVEFKGQDFLYIHLNGAGSVNTVCSGQTDVLRINGTEQMKARAV